MSKRFLGKVLAVAIMVSLSIMGCGSTTTDDTKIENEEVTKETTEIKQKVTETSSDEKIVVRIGDMRTQYPVKASYELGLLQEAFGDNVEIELYTFGAGAELIEALAAGEIDISGGFGATPVIAGISAGYPITIINVSNTRFNQINTHGIITRIDSGIDSVEDIAGHTFGLMIGSGEYTAFNNILSKHGLAEDDYELVSLSNADAYTALVAGSVDAAVTIEPYITKLTDTGEYKVVAWNTEYNAGGGLQIANAEFAKEHPEIVSEFLKVYFDIQLWAHENDDNKNTVLQIVADQIGIEASELEAQFNQDNLYFGFEDEDIELVQNNVPELVNQGTISKEINVADYVDSSFIEAAGYKEYFKTLITE